MDLIDDPEAVRDVLGVTELDADDELVSSLMYGATADAQIKALVPTWATIIDKNDGNYDELKEIRLRRVAALYCASLICPRFADGGAIGLVAGGNHQQVDWPKRCADLSLAFASALAQLNNPDPAASAAALLPTAMFTMSRGRKKPNWKTYPPLAELGNVIPDD